MKKIFAITLIAFFALLTDLNGQTTWTGATDTDWFNIANWDNGLPAPGNDATIPAGLILYPIVPGGLVINFDLNNSGSITVGGLSNQSSGTINNSGTINVGLTFFSNSLLVNYSSFSNSGSINVFGKLVNQGNLGIGAFDNSGSIVVFGRLDNFVGGMFNNSGLLTVNMGHLFQGNLVNNSNSTFNNNGPITTRGLLNIGSFNNSSSINISNHLNIFLNSTLDNIGSINVSGTLTNSGSIGNDGSIYLCGVLVGSDSSPNLIIVNTLGASCDDGDPCTFNDVIDASCNCAGTNDADNDGVSNCDDGCPFDPLKTSFGVCGCGNPDPGTLCDDGDPLTVNDVIFDYCACVGVLFTPDDMSISDPCTCLNNASTSNDGQFYEIIEVDAPAGQTWTVVSAPGLYLLSSPPPPAAPIPVAIGTVLTYNAGTAMYEQEGIHIDGVGYNIVVTNGTDVLGMTNLCNYPKITFDIGAYISFADLPTAALTLTEVINVASGNPALGAGTFLLLDSNGDPVPIVGDELPATLNSGELYTLVYEFTEDAQPIIAPGPNTPGCTQEIVTQFLILSVGCE